MQLMTVAQIGANGAEHRTNNANSTGLSIFY